MKKNKNYLQKLIGEVKTKYNMSGLKLFILIILTSCQTHTELNQDNSASKVIERKLMLWVDDFENKNMEGVKSIFSKKLIGSYQGSNDQGYENIEQSYWFGNDSILPKYDLEIEEINVKNGLGYVRDTWTYTETNINTNKVNTTLKVRSYEIWSKENDDEWRIIRWISYPIKN